MYVSFGIGKVVVVGIKRRMIVYRCIVIWKFYRFIANVLYFNIDGSYMVIYNYHILSILLIYICIIIKSVKEFLSLFILLYVSYILF